MAATKPETLKEKREAIERSVAGGFINRFGPGCEIDVTDEPPLLVLFYFKVKEHPGSITTDDYGAMDRYLRRVLNERGKQLERAASLKHSSACLNDLDAVAFYIDLCNTLKAVIESHEFMLAEMNRVKLAASQPFIL